MVFVITEKSNCPFEVANKLKEKESIWIFDEYSLDSIKINGKSIDFKVMDEFNFSDQDTSQSDIYDFIATYCAEKCKFKDRYEIFFVKFTSFFNKLFCL